MSSLKLDEIEARAIAELDTRLDVYARDRMRSHLAREDVAALVARVRELEAELGDGADAGMAVRGLAAQAMRERDAAIARLEAVLDGLPRMCSYCGEELGVGADRDAHMRSCEKHPLGAAIARVATLDKEFADCRRSLEAAQRRGDEQAARAEQAERELAGWRSVAEYVLGDYADTHTPEECRAEAMLRATEEGKELAALRAALVAVRGPFAETYPESPVLAQVDAALAGTTTDPRDAALTDLREAAHRHVTKGHHERCSSYGTRRERDEIPPCDCGFDEARAAMKAVPR